MKDDLPGPPGSAPAWLSSQRRLFVALALVFVGTWVWRTLLNEAPPAPIAYSQFYALLTEGKVQSVVMSGEALDATLKGPETVAGRTLQKVHTTAAPNDPALLPLLRQKGVQIDVNSQQQSLPVQIMLSLLPWALIIGFWLWMSRRAKTMLGAGQSIRRHGQEPEPQVRQGDVGERHLRGHRGTEGRQARSAGSGGVPQAAGSLPAPGREGAARRSPDRAAGHGQDAAGAGGGGRVGRGRSISISASEFIEMFVGLGAARVRDLFRDAKKSAPAIVFIDEIDAVGRARGAGLGVGNDEREQTLNQLLSEMDGFERSDLVVVIAATNRPDVLDPALLRPGRFDRRVLVDRPELAARQAILDVHAKGKPLALDVNLQVVAQNTPGFSGADLANLVNEAALSATREGRESITAADFTEAFDKIVLGDPREAKLDAKEKRRVAIHEAGHAVVAAFSPETEPLHRVSIIPRGMALGVTQQSPGADRHLMAEAELESRLRVLMGGHAAERLVLASISTGAENDLKEATRLASRMVAHFGMSERLGPVYYDHDAEHPFLGMRVATEGGTSPATTNAIEEEARRLLRRALDEAGELLKRQRPALDRLYRALLERESLERDELVAILGRARRRGRRRHRRCGRRRV